MNSSELPVHARAPGDAASLDHWLSWLERLHPVEIELGLERIGRVAGRAGLLCVELPLITVAGTNGKGSTVAMLAAIYRQAGYQVGDYTSPHIDTFNERIRLQGKPVENATIVSALARVEAVRGGESLTYYEYTTLAAMMIFLDARCDVVVLEVGLGGRLDATNLWSADCAIVTSIALDHQAWLGNDRATISLEKVAIGRSGRPMIIGDTDPPPAMIEHARQVGMQVVRPTASTADDDAGGSAGADAGGAAAAASPGLDGGGARRGASFALQGEHQRRNRACALAAVDALHARLPVKAADAAQALCEVQVAGRMELRRIGGRQVLLDVAHNPAAALELARMLTADHAGQTVDVIFAALADKDVAGIVRQLAPCVRHWHCVQLDVPRALPVEALVGLVQEGRAGAGCGASADSQPSQGDADSDACTGSGTGADPGSVYSHADADAAWKVVCNESNSALILVTGSFYTVSAALAAGNVHER